MYAKAYHNQNYYRISPWPSGTVQAAAAAPLLASCNFRKARSVSPKYRLTPLPSTTHSTIPHSTTPHYISLHYTPLH